MPIIRHLLAISACAVVPFAPGTSQAQAIKVRDFSVATAGNDRTYSLTDEPELRRQTTSHVQIIKDFIDLVSFNQVRATGATLSNIDNGRTSSGGRQVGYISMDVNVPASASPGSTIEIAVGLTDKFRFKAVRKGLVSGVALEPMPSTVQAGTPIRMTATGVDFGTPAVVRAACHTVTNVVRTGTTLTATLTRSASCAINPSQYVFGIESTASGDPTTYTKSNGDGTFDFTYAAVPATPGVTCISNPTIGQPTISAPINGSTINFAAGAPSPTAIAVRWSLNDINGRSLAPNNEFLLTVKHGRTSDTRTFTGPGTVISVPIGTTVTIDLRAKNCGENSPTSSISFITKFQ